MREILLIMLAGLLISPVFAQDDELPAKVNEAFKTKYPKATSVYGYSDGNSYKIEFEISMDNYTAEYTENGKWVETSKIVSEDDIPAKASSAINKKYAGVSVSNAEYVENAKGEKYYRLSCYTEDADYNINITADGAILKSEKIENTFEIEEDE